MTIDERIIKAHAEYLMDNAVDRLCVSINSFTNMQGINPYDIFKVIKRFSPKTIYLYDTQKYFNQARSCVDEVTRKLFYKVHSEIDNIVNILVILLNDDYEYRRVYVENCGFNAGMQYYPTSDFAKLRVNNKTYDRRNITTDFLFTDSLFLYNKFCLESCLFIDENFKKKYLINEVISQKYEVCTFVNFLSSEELTEALDYVENITNEPYKNF